PHVLVRVGADFLDQPVYERIGMEMDARYRQPLFSESIQPLLHPPDEIRVIALRDMPANFPLQLSEIILELGGFRSCRWLFRDLRCHEQPATSVEKPSRQRPQSLLVGAMQILPVR